MADYPTAAEAARADRAATSAGQRAGRRAGPAQLPRRLHEATRRPQSTEDASYRNGLRSGLKENARARARRGGAQIASAAGGPKLWHVLWLAVGLVALYLVVTSASTVTGVFGGLQKAVTWLFSPTATI